MTDRQVVLITGCSSGIGLATAAAASRAGWTVIATVRSPDRADALRAAAPDALVRRLDVTDEESVAACFAGVDHLDALVNNAGISNFDPTLEMSTSAALRANLDVNFFGTVAVSRAAMPLLRASRGRMLTIGSVHGVVGQPFNEAYCAAKFAVEGFMEALAPVAAAHGVRVSMLVPGYVPDTNFGVFPDVNRSTVQAASGPYADTFASYVDRLGKGWASAGQPAAEVAEAVLQALAEDRPAFRIPANAWAAGYLDAKLADRDGTAIQRLAHDWIGLTPAP
ncbi:SDR family NAD(P)-dependent oxidoreductase [Kitasatospora sp. NPDC049285]|uniref:SDR family NAD(P)-dependent oxidoreductase n=1 Tax=Kitasatospora sp. NPDC049285 TaxID=3157096 RepID=UPI00343B6B0B